MISPLASQTELQSMELIELHDYWTRLRGKRFAPALREVDTREISRLLPWVWLVDVVDGGEDFLFRLGGERIIEYVGRRLSGARLNHFRNQPFFEAMREAFSVCVKTQVPVQRGPTPSALKERNFRNLQVLILPLSADGEAVTQLIGGLTFVAEEQRKSA